MVLDSMAAVTTPMCAVTLRLCAHSIDGGHMVLDSMAADRHPQQDAAGRIGAGEGYPYGRPPKRHCPFSTILLWPHCTPCGGESAQVHYGCQKLCVCAVTTFTAKGACPSIDVEHMWKLLEDGQTDRQTDRQT